jgi:hypothetical protein
MAKRFQKVSDLDSKDYDLVFRCPQSLNYAKFMDAPACNGSTRFSPREFIRRYGDRRLVDLRNIRCPYCDSTLSYIGLTQMNACRNTVEEQYYEYEIQTYYISMFVVLAVCSLGLFGLSLVLPRDLVFILAASILISATLIVVFLTLFTFVGRVRGAVIAFERNLRQVTVTVLLLCLAVTLLALLILAVF